MQLADWQAQGQYFTYQGHQIFFQEAGQGPPLLMLHGFPTASWDWHKVWARLGQHFRLIAPDFIGFGYSDKPRPYPYAIMDQADLVQALLAHLGIGEVRILAHDYGDTVAQELLARDRDRQKAGTEGLRYPEVLLLNGGIFPDAHRPRTIQKLLASPIGTFMTPFLSKRKLRSNFHAIFGPETPPTAQEVDEFYSLMTHKRGKSIFHLLIRYMHDREQHRDRWVSALTQTQARLCLLNGAQDPISGRHVAEIFRAEVPQAKLILLDQIGHYPQTEAPEAVIDAATEFFSRIS